MINWSKPYERTETEYEPMATGDWFAPIECRHCGEPGGYHRQTADGKVWCVKNIAERGAHESA